MKTILSAATALAIILGSSAAFADSGDGPQFNLPQPVPAAGPATATFAAAPLAHDVNIAAEPSFGGGTDPAVVALGGGSFLPANGNEAPVQTANSAPTGFGTDTIALAARIPGLGIFAQR